MAHMDQSHTLLTGYCPEAGDLVKALGVTQDHVKEVNISIKADEIAKVTVTYHVTNQAARDATGYIEGVIAKRYCLKLIDEET